MQALKNLKCFKSCSYDLVTIGAHAQKVGKVAGKFYGSDLKVLSLEADKTVV